MSATISLHGPFKFKATLVDRGDPFVTLDVLSDSLTVYLMRVTRAEMDALVKAALAARDLLPGAGPCGDIAEHTGRSCELAPGHEEWHRSGMITWSWAGALVCASCGATEDLQPVHDTGGDGTVSYYCANSGACGRRRQQAAKAGAVAQ